MEKIKRVSLEEINFSPEYFYDEVREGFYISTMMKRYWASQLKVLSHIARICKAHGIKWYADCGTLIGAVRHEGYVPWDDDLDICMLRSDWLRFFEIAPKELPLEFEVLTIASCPEYSEIIGRVVNSHAIDYSQEHLKEFYGCPYTVGIDIFPLDGVYDDAAKEDERKKRTRKALGLLSQMQAGDSINDHSNLVKEIEKENHIFFDKKKSMERQLILLSEKLYSECSSDEAENVALMPFFIPGDNHKYPKELFENIVEIPFENTYINVPARYDEVLRIEYGDFMQINKGGGIHEYPVYSDQQEILKNAIGHNPFAYTLDYNELLSSVQRYAARLVSPKKVPGRKVVALLPVRARWWNTMKPLWQYYASKPDEYEVHVLPIFYYDFDYNGIPGERHDERENFPGDVSVTACEKFDFETIHPDIIVMQVPFDGYNTSMSVHEFFYSSNMQKFTDELIYVPCYDIEDPNTAGDKAERAIGTLVEQPAVINADRVILSSDKQKEIYLSKLIGLTGEDTANYWKQKIVTLKEYCGDKNGEDSTKADSSDEEWNSLVGDAQDGKVIIYYISISMLLRGKEKAIDKIKRSLRIFAEAQDKIIAVIEPQEAITTQLEGTDSLLWEQFNELKESLGSAEYPNCKYDPEHIALKHKDKWSAFYGDTGSIPRQCVQMGIPVMIENMDI